MNKFINTKKVLVIQQSILTKDIISNITSKSYIHSYNNKCQLLLNKGNSKSLINNHRLYSTMVNRIHSNISKGLCQIKYLLSNQKQTLISGSILFSNMSSSSNKSEETEKIRSNEENELETSNSESEDIAFYDELRKIDFERSFIKDYHEWIVSSWTDFEYKFTIEDGPPAEHSERLALASNFLNGAKPTFIQITSKLRICPDCHEYMKQVAKMRKCEILLRDSNRIHRFSTNGECSCKDHL